jgi:hypothetical protein
MRAAWIVAPAVLAGLALAATADEPKPVKDRASFLPYRKYALLKGKSVGILVSDVRAFMAHDGRGGPPDAMAFSADDNGYRWVYVPTPDAKNPLISNLSVEVGDKPNLKRKLYPKLGMANAKEVKRWQIDVPYALVEVEVNDGEGSPPTEAFVATKMTRLDGTKDYPLKLPDVVADAKKRYAAHVKDRQKKIDDEMADVQKKVLKGRKVTGPKTTDELIYLTWLPQTQRVKVAFRTRIEDGAYTVKKVRGGRPFELPPPPRKDAGKEKKTAYRPPPPREIEVKYGVGFGVEVGAAYEYDVKGKLAATSELTPQSFSKEILPPPNLKE